MGTKKLTLTYLLEVYSNFQKLEDVRYSLSRYKLYTQHFTTQLYFKPVRFLPTKGMGKLANQAQKRAVGILAAHRAAIKETGEKSNCPQIKFDACPASIAPSKKSSFDYWVTVTSQWQNRVRIPAKSHSKLNAKLRAGWELSGHCEVTPAKNGKWYVRVFVTKEVAIPEPKSGFMGVDVGIAHGVTRSDKYLGKSLKGILCKERDAQRERSRQGHKKKPFKTILKQQLDTEVNRALRRSKARGWNLVVENPKVLSNLRMDRWARSYFANRATIRAIEEGVWITYVNPVYTSQTCSGCGIIDKQSRVSQCTFRCVACGSTLNADYNASINIARKGQESLGQEALAINPLESPLGGRSLGRQV